MAAKLPVGRILCLGEGEGRNAVWLAQQGHLNANQDVYLDQTVTIA